MRKALFWLGVTTVGAVISVYGNIQVQKAVREETEKKNGEAVIKAFNRASLKVAEGKVEEIA